MTSPQTPNPQTPNPQTPNPQTPNPQTPNPQTPNPETPNPETPKPKVDLKATQVAGTALGAVTAAVAGSTLGTAGTLVGAAAASAVFTISSAVYRASLEHSREKVRLLAQRTRPNPAEGKADGTAPADATAADEHPVDEPVPAHATEGTGDAEGPAQPVGGLRRFASLRWGAVAVGSVAAFVLAMLAITGFETVTGQTVSGKEGTTLGRVVEAGPGPRGPAVPSAPPSTTESPSVSTTESPEPSTSPNAPQDGSGAERSPFTTSNTPTPSEETPPPLLPTGLPGPGDR